MPCFIKFQEANSSKSPYHHYQAKSSGNDNTQSNSQRGLSTSGSVLSNNSSEFLNNIDLVMNKIQGIQLDQKCSRVIKHCTGVQVGSSKLWDEWYEDGNLVENLNYQVSLTYMCMKAGIGTCNQDLSLVKKVEVAENCSFNFCASSIDTPRVPTVPGRIRAHIQLHAWVLEPIFLSHSSLPPNSNSASTKHGSKIQIDGLNQAESQPGQGGTNNGLQRNYMSIQQLDFSPQTNHARLPSSTNNNPST
ncbi:hypothetical protein O181_106675 [Austropuccinia psidii MF-1]|uniref:Uncharacterized protein n=1 Tax=Austropuccinia psidii MF-1 TaxID=1389203 RepID=A0A9Q3PMX3_9BASI|nr:hypothetical protein [Austropuccinia psidii MF-1]